MLNNEEKKNSLNLDMANNNYCNRFKILYLQFQGTLITLLKQIGCNNSADTYYTLGMPVQA